MSKEKIGTGTAILLVSLMGLSFLDIPYNAAKVGPSGYWSAFIAFGLTVALIWLISAFSRRFPDSNLFEVAPKAIGRIPALIGNIMFISVFLLWLIFSIRDSANLVLIYMLNRTPLWVILAVFLTGAGYVAFSGLKSVAYLASFVLIPTVVFRLVMQLFSFQKMATSHLLPAFSAPLADYMGGGLVLFCYFSPVITFFLIHPNLTKKKTVTPVLFGTTGMALLIFILAIVSTIGVFGATYTQYYAWPELNAVNHVNIPFLSVEQAGLLFLIVWLTTFFVACAFYLYLVAQGLTLQFPALKYRWVLIGLLLLIGVSGFLFPNAPLVHTWFTSFRIWAMAPWVIYPAIIYFIAVLRKVGGR